MQSEREQTLDEIEASFTLPPDNDDPVPTPIDEEARQLELYGKSTHDIEALRAKCVTLSCDTKQGYEDTRRMIALLRTTRGRIEKRRKSLNEEHQAAIKYVNGVAKKIIGTIESLETPLKALKAEVDERAEREKKAAEEAEARRIEDERLSKIAFEEAERRAAHEAEQARLKIEADKLAAERAAMEAERRRIDELLAKERQAQAERDAAERARLDAIRQEDMKRQREAQEKLDAERAELARQQKVIDDAKAAVERAEFERLAKIKAEKEAAEKVERDRIAAELAAKAKAEAEEKEQQRLAELAPDIEKVHAYAAVIRCLPNPPATKSKAAQDALTLAVERLGKTAAGLEAFKP